MEIDSSILEFSLKILSVIGVTSIVGFLSAYVAWITFFPNIVVESVVNKSDDYSYASKLKIKNIGKIPAKHLSADTYNFCAKFMGNTMNNCGSFNGPPLASILSGTESTEISVSPGMKFGGGIKLDECSFDLKIKYQSKLFWITKKMDRVWHLELENYPDGKYSWVVKNA